VATFYSITHGALVKTTEANDRWTSERVFSTCQPYQVTQDLSNPSRLLIATERGVFESQDAASSWRSLGLGDKIVKSVAVTPDDPNLIYAGTKPAYMYASRDGGMTWSELRGFRRIPGRRFWFSPAEKPFKAYVQQIAICPTTPDVMLAGIEFGAVVRSDDGGITWTGHRRQALRDCHSLSFHAHNGNYVYEGGGTGGGAAFSRDAGQTWTRPTRNTRKGYGWAVASDPADPETWFVSLSSGPFKGHSLAGNAGSVLVRFTGDRGDVLSGGLPEPLPYMPYAIMPSQRNQGVLYAAMSNGDLWKSDDRGNHWKQLPANIGDVVRSAILIG
jgi:photosystem II stability/assembly factor-like uncharacterized protein